MGGSSGGIWHQVVLYYKPIFFFCQILSLYFLLSRTFPTTASSFLSQWTKSREGGLCYAQVVEWARHKPFCLSCTSACLKSTPFLLPHNAAKAYGRGPVWSDRVFFVTNPSTGDSSLEHVRHSSGNCSTSLVIGVLDVLKNSGQSTPGAVPCSAEFGQQKSHSRSFLCLFAFVFLREKKNTMLNGWTGEGSGST